MESDRVANVNCNREKYQGSMTTRERINHFDWVADNDAKVRKQQTAFHTQLLNEHRFHIPKGSRVMEWGCGAGDLLAGLEPARGLGLDFSSKMVRKAQAKYGKFSDLEFRVGDIQEDVVSEQFDHIILNYLIGYLSDIQESLERLHHASAPSTRLYVTTLNTPWQFVLRICTKLGMVMPQPPSNWISAGDLENLLELAGWEVVRRETLQLCPLKVPLIASIFNRYLVRLPGLRHFGVTVSIIAKPRRTRGEAGSFRCSVIVPARNESGNIRPALDRIPVLGAGTEIIFVEGNSKDDTWAVIEREVASYRGPHKLIALRQPGRGKWDAVRAGFEVATGDVLVIQDADLTAPPEDLPKFWAALTSGAAEFVNGSRLVYPMEKKAMRFLNFLGNKFFALALTYVLGQPVKDSLCGTKMLWRSDYEQLKKRIAVLGDFDPFGDFNLLFGACLLNLKIRDLPVRYRDRTYGETNISRFAHGWLLLKMTWFGLRRLKWR
jgi:2-polyprenyl-3-methyl-5-hydroxy-6-metoxy-1,4-benzoquinol methylase